MGTTAGWGSSHINLKSQGQGDSADHLSNITLSTLLAGGLTPVSTQGYQVAVTENSCWKGYSAPDYGLARRPCAPSHPWPHMTVTVFVATPQMF